MVYAPFFGMVLTLQCFNLAPPYFCSSCTANPPNSSLRYATVIRPFLYFAELSSYAKPFFASSATASATEFVRTAMWPFFALEHRLHDLDAVGGKDGGIAFLDGQGRTPSFQLLADGRRRRGIFAVDADVRDLKAERGASRLLAERGDLFKNCPAAMSAFGQTQLPPTAWMNGAAMELADVLAVDATGRDELDPAERA